MKKLILFLFILPLFVFGQNEQTKEEVTTRYKNYLREYLDDGGTIVSDNKVKAAYIQAVGSDMMDSVKFLWFGEAASSKRTSTIYDYYTKIYDMSGLDNHGTQTTEASQPYVTGNVARTEHQGAKNPNRDTRYFTHPEISFSATDEWSVTTVLNWSGTSVTDAWYTQNDAANSFRGIAIKKTNNEFYFRSNLSGGSEITFSSSNTDELIGKNSIATFVADGNGNLSLYVNGDFVQTVSVTTSVGFVKFMNRGDTGFGLTGTISAHIIRAQALTPTKVEAEAAFLQEVYPEIPSVQIGTEYIATSNFEAVASSNGTVITEAADNTDWATGVARWRYYNDDSQIGSWGGKLYNKAARDVIIANPPSGWHVATEAELTVLASYGANKLKVEGTDYWTTANGTNYTGFSAVGTGKVNTDGTFASINSLTGIWCADSDKALIINDSNTATITAVSANEGYSIRLVKD